MTQIFKLLMILFIPVFIISCSSKNNTGNESEEVETIENITISGIVRSLEHGKDGYTSNIQTDEGDTYAALVSIVNLGGPENFIQFKLGDKVTVSGTTSMIGAEKQLKVDKIITVENTRTGLMISEDSFRGIKVGDKIADHSDYIKKEVMETGEGDFEVYTIKDFNNNPAGFFYLDMNDESLVGDITVETMMAETAEGIKIGSTFGDLKAALPTIEVHGSEIEGRTHATHNSLSYRLDIPNFSYEVNVEKIPLDTKIREIIIHSN